LLTSVYGIEVVAAGESEKYAALVVDANTGQILHADQADALRHPASLTKMMTLYLVFEAIEQRRLSYTTRLEVSEAAAMSPPSRLDLQPGSTIRVGDAIKALITKSANDIAVVFAEHLAGSEHRFARLMTERARRLGMAHTTFRNASGLPDPGQVTTARDMVTLAFRLQDHFPVHYRLFSTRHFTYDGHRYRNHNNLLHRFQGTEGIKTGYVRSSGFNLVAAVRRGRRHVIGVIFGGRTPAHRDDAMQLLLTRALTRASPVRTRVPLPMLVARERAVPRRVTAVLQETRPSSEVPRPVPARRPPSPSARPEAVSWRGAVQPGHVHGAGSTGDADPRLGKPPSTLQQQAARLERGTYAEPSHVSRGNSVMRGGYEVQIGAYSSAGEAERALASARSSAGSVLTDRRGVAIPVRKETSLLYRARFSGFNSADAASTCNALRRLKFDCFVMRAD
jgi:D-alanyl-D-alanine carboxypeptidase